MHQQSYSDEDVLTYKLTVDVIKLKLCRLKANTDVSFMEEKNSFTNNSNR
ncbi:hypothetical protein BB561_001664 [Smittium simulii]|uniref:Uncharacterized protein n=1 Tax=Smittium simulii TaxID=133385 RepID=A0A2T9YTM9_9FUNG|nr:hypothetical protein BB561_001664 [Smittium simulii]